MFFKTMKHFKTFFAICVFCCVGIAAFAQSRAPAGRGAPVPPREMSTVRFRCAYWDASQRTAEKLFVKERKGFRYLNLGVMAFIGEYTYSGPLPVPIYRKATEAEIAQRKADPDVPKSEVEYVRMYEIDPHGLKYFGAILLPSAPEKNFEKPLIFDLDMKAFPPGAIRFFNYTRRPIGVRYEVESEPDVKAALSIRHGASAISPVISGDRGMFKLGVFTKSKGATDLQEIFRTVGVVQKNVRLCAFFVPDAKKSDKESGKIVLECRTMKIIPTPEPDNAPAVGADDDDSPQKRGARKDRDNAPRKTRRSK